MDPVEQIKQLITPDLLHHIYEGVEPSYQVRYPLEELQQIFDNPMDLLLAISRRSQDPIIRNLSCPVGETYAPIYYDADCFLKLVIKKGGIYPALILWDLLVVDLDQDQTMMSLENLKTMIMQSPYHDQLFYVHQTRHGYHLYLMSQPVLYCSSLAMHIRHDLHCDPIYGAFSLYRGSSIRLSRKPEETTIPSRKIAQIGTGQVDPRVDRIYQKCLYYLNMFQDEYYQSFSQQGLQKLWTLWEQTLMKNDNFGLVHIAVTAPLMLYKKGSIIGINELVDESPELDYAWVQFRLNPVITDDNLDVLIRAARRLKQYQNMYRILEATDDYVIGVHTEEALHFISYRNLLMIDYDHPEDLTKVQIYQQQHPEKIFRVVSTHRGYHVFLTSHPIDHASPEAMAMMRELGSDHPYILSCRLRGYSVRLNPKYDDEKPYQEVAILGNHKENSHLVTLYQKHLQLYFEKRDCEHYLCMKNAAIQYLLEMGSKLQQQQLPSSSSDPK